MKKKISIAFLIVTLIFSMIVPTKNVYAKGIETLEVSGKNEKIAVSGNTQEGVLAVAISVFDENETKLLTTETTSVNDNNKFEYSINMQEGKYTVKVADYDGGEYISKKVTVEKLKEESNENKDENTNDEDKTESDTKENNNVKEEANKDEETKDDDLDSCK